MKSDLSGHALALAWLLAPCVAAAQVASSSSPSPAPTIAQLEDIVVTASRTPQPQRDVLGDVTVVDRHELEQAGASSLAQVLGQRHGIEFSENGGPQTTTGLYIRGANANQTLVLIDGVPINGATSGLAALNALPPDSIDHVEILRGSASSLYGADAIGGVVNVITRPDTDRPLSARASAGFGTYGTSQYTAGFSGAQDGWSYSLGSSYGQSHGYNATNAHAGSSYNADQDSYYTRNLNGSLGYEWKKGQKLTFQGYNTRINGGFDGSAYPYDDRSVQTLELYSLASENQITQDWKSTLRYAYTEDTNSTQYGDPINASLDGVIRTRQNQYTWQNDLRLARNQRLTLAYEHLDQQVSGTTDYDQTRRHDDAFTGVYRGDFGRHHLQASLRNDDDSQFGSASTWGLSYGYDLTSRLRGYVAGNTGFKTPTFNDLYYPAFPGFPSTANPDLKPEKSRNVEMGLKYTGETTVLGIVAYRNEVRDLIVSGPPDYVPYNVGRATLRGLTLTAEKDFGRTTLRASADFQDPHDDTNDQQLTRRARQIYRFSLDHRVDAWTLGGEYQFVGKRYDDYYDEATFQTARATLGGYGLLNLTAGYRLNKHMDISLRWNNVLDKAYTTVYGYNTAGSNVFVNLAWKM